MEQMCKMIGGRPRRAKNNDKKKRYRLTTMMPGRVADLFTWRTEPVFVDLLRRPGIDSQPAGYDNSIFRTGPPGYKGWRNRFPGSTNVYKYGLRTRRAK
jgi:hypothetical protein